MYLEKNLEKKWLIKSENRIMGPYNFDQILDLLRRKQISIIDEVRDPETRWLYVRENNEFKHIVEEIRKEIDSKQESTKTYQSAAGFTSVTTTTFDDQVQKTKTDIVFEDEESTNAREVEIVKETLTEPSQARNNERSVSAESTNSGFNTPPEPPKEKAKIYGVLSDTAVQNKISDYSRRLKIAAAAIVLVAVSSVASYFYYQKRSVIKKEEETIAQVKRLRYIGLYDKAAEYFKELNPASQKDLLPIILDMFPALQRAASVSVEDAQELNGLTSEQKALVELIAFWDAVKQGDLNKAQDRITLAIGHDPKLMLLKENDAWLTYKKNQYLKAYGQYNKLFENEKNGRYLFGMLVAYAAMNTVERASFSKDLLTQLERYTIVFFDLRKELLLGQIYLARELNEELIYNISLKQFLNTPTQMASRFMRPALLYPEAYSWKDLESISVAIKTKLTGDSAILFQMHDLIEQARLNEASEYLRINESKTNSSQVKAQLNLLLLNAQNRTKDVEALGQTKTLDNTSELNAFLTALNYINADPKKNISQQLQVLDSKEYGFYKEWLELEQLKAKGASQALRDYLQNHFVTYDSFIPFIEAKNQVN